MSYNASCQKLMKKLDNVYKRVKDGSIEVSEMEDLDTELSRFTDGDYQEE